MTFKAGTKDSIDSHQIKLIRRAADICIGNGTLFHDELCILYICICVYISAADRNKLGGNTPYVNIHQQFPHIF